MRKFTVFIILVLTICSFMLTSCHQESNECVHEEKKILEEKAASCNEDGLTEGEACAICGEILREQDVIPKYTSHEFFNGSCRHCDALDPYSTLEFTLSEDGKYRILSGIGEYTDEELIVPTEHDLKPVKEIAAEAFKNNKTLKKVVIPEGITKVGDHAFSNCSVEEAEINTANAELGIYLFERSGIKKLTLHNDIKIIPAGIFYQCGGIKEFTIGENIEEIHNNAFAYTAIEKLTIPGNVKIVGYRAFYYCEELKELTICEGVTQIISQAFFGCFRYVDPECIVLPDSLTVLDREAFRSCGYITELVIGDGLEEISARAFYGCDIDKVVIGKKVNKIGEDAFTSTHCNYHIESMEQWNAIKNYNQIMGAFGYALYVNGEKVYSSY